MWYKLTHYIIWKTSYNPFIDFDRIIRTNNSLWKNKKQEIK